MINKRNLFIIEYLMKNNGNGQIRELAEKVNLSERSIRYDIDNINEYLEEEGFPKIEKLAKGKIFFENTDQFKEFFYKNYNQYLILPEERIVYLFLKILFSDFINLNQLSEKLDISRSTIKVDLKSVKETLDEYNLNLKLEHKIGLYMEDEEENIRKLAIKVLMKYFEKYEIFKKNKKQFIKDTFILNEIEECIGNLELETIRTFINYNQKLMNKIISDEAYRIITLYIAVSIIRIRKNSSLESIKNEKFLLSTQEYENLNKSISILEANFEISFNKNEILKMTDYFLGSHTYNFKHSYYENWVEVEILIKKLIEDFNKKIDVNILKDSLLLEGLINHIKPTIYRIKNKIELQNSIYEEVIKSYPNLYEITKEVIKGLEEFAQETFSKDEIAFLVIHFKASIDRNKYKLKNIKRVLIVCGMGYGTSKLLAQQLKDIYDVTIIDIIPSHLLNKTMEKNLEIDMIISTMDINGEASFNEIPIIKVNPIIGREDIHKLDKYNFPRYRKKILLSNILAIVENNTEILNKDNLITEFSELLDDRLINDLSDNELTLLDTLLQSNVSLNVETEDVYEAIEVAGNILVENEYVNDGYVQDMVNSVKELGSYIVISPGIAIPHYKWGNNVIKTGMSLITLSKPVFFPNGKEVEIILAFASLDGKEHLNSLVDLMNIINQKNFKEEVKRAHHPKEVIKIIKEYCLNKNQ